MKVNRGWHVGDHGRAKGPRTEKERLRERTDSATFERKAKSERRVRRRERARVFDIPDCVGNRHDPKSRCVPPCNYIGRSVSDIAGSSSSTIRHDGWLMESNAKPRQPLVIIAQRRCVAHRPYDASRCAIVYVLEKGRSKSFLVLPIGT